MYPFTFRKKMLPSLFNLSENLCSKLSIDLLGLPYMYHTSPWQYSHCFLASNCTYSAAWLPSSHGKPSSMPPKGVLAYGCFFSPLKDKPWFQTWLELLPPDPLPLALPLPPLLNPDCCWWLKDVACWLPRPRHPPRTLPCAPPRTLPCAPPRTLLCAPPRTLLCAPPRVNPWVPPRVATWPPRPPPCPPPNLVCHCCPP